MTKRKKENLSADIIQDDVDAVMKDWRNYDNFASFLDALMKANDNMDNAALAQELSRYDYTAYNTARAPELSKASHNYSKSQIRNVRIGETIPSYQLVEDLLTANPLHLRKVTIGNETIDPRIVLFTKAELWEVTDESTLDFTDQVMTKVRNKLNAGVAQHWADIMQKLLDFRTQGGRDSINGIQQTLYDRMRGDGQDEEEGCNVPARFHRILGKHSYAKDSERLSLYDYLGLNGEQRNIADDKRVYNDLCPAKESDFAPTLDRILKQLKTRKVTTITLEDKSRDPQGKKQISTGGLSQWRNGLFSPDLNSVRILVDILQPYVFTGGILTQTDIDTLIQHSSFTREQLTYTARQFIDKSDEPTADIHTLLKNIRNAVDINVDVETIAATVPSKSQLSLDKNQIFHWETDGNIFPPEEPLRELMLRYNYLLEVGHLCKFMAGLQVEEGQSLCKTLNVWFGDKLESPLTPERLGTAKVPLAVFISGQYPDAPDKLNAFLDAIEMEMGKDNPLKPYKERLLKEGNPTPLTSEDIDKVCCIAKNGRARYQPLSFAEKLAKQQPGTWRKHITPYVEEYKTPDTRCAG